MSNQFRNIPCIKYLIQITCCLCLTDYGFSQDIVARNILRIDTTIAVNDTRLILEENHTIDPESIHITAASNEPYEYMVENNRVIVSEKKLLDTIRIRYALLSYNLEENQSVIDSNDILNHEYATPAPTINDGTFSRRYIANSKLEYTGSFSRGVSFGNTQDVVLNSNFNLQLKGDLGNGLNVRAAISDDNIPIQPEGNTQVLQEFDKVFIEISKDRTSVIAGDYELSYNKGYFTRYYKKLKGLSATFQSKVDPSRWQVYSKGSFAVSRGKFRRQILNTTDANQGPYRLEGDNGEVFLQVLSGTEKVYADGRLLKRGEDNDYVIDYNRAEIRFTPNMIINTNIRIIVEFEYAIQSYLRSLYAAESSISNDKWTFNINVYNEQDSKTLSNNLQLDSLDIKALQEGGDGTIVRSGIFELNEDNFENTNHYVLNNNILQFTSIDTGQLVGAVFTNFGQGNGSYIIDGQQGVNGRIYQYVGSGMGNYEPAVQLVAPEKKQLSSFSGQYNFSDSTYVYLETAISNNDQNRFSNLDNDDNTATSIHGRFSDIRALGISQKWHLETDLQFEQTGSGFQALNPYRNAEFARDWNVANVFIADQKQQWYQARFLLKNHLNAIEYGLSNYKDGDIYNGLKHIAEYNLQYNSWRIMLKGDWLDATGSIRNTSFVRPRARLEKEVFSNKHKIGFYFEKERLVNELVSTENLEATSLNYDLFDYYIASKVSKNLQFKIGNIIRKDERAIDDQLEQVTVGTDYYINGLWTIKRNSILNWKFNLRDFDVEDKYLEQEQPTLTFVGNLDHKLTVLKNALSLQSYYESNAGQEPKLEFQYVKVQVGEGTYVWNDYNQDSLEQVNEFEVAPFSDLAAYEKVRIFNNEFVRTQRNVLNQSLKFEPKILINNPKKLISKLSWMSRYRIEQKLENDAGGDFKFINLDLEDTTLVSYASSFDHSIFFNRGNPAYDFQLSWRGINNKTNQITGFEQRLLNSIYGRLRVNLKSKLDAIFEVTNGEKIRDSENFESQRYHINYWQFIPQLNFRPTTQLRFVLKYKYERNVNILSSTLERSRIHDIGLELTWRHNRTSNLQFQFNLINIDFNGLSNSAIEFEMLQGLKQGTNALININYTRRISNNLDLILNYSGRKSEDSSFINIANMQIRAIF